MKLTLLTPGKCKQPHYTAAQQDLLKKISNLAKCEIIETREVNPKSKSQEASCKQQENQNLIDKLPIDSLIIALDETGKEYDATGWGRLMQRQIDEGRDVCFIVGGTNGLSPEMLQKADQKIALGKCTLTQDLARVTLLECMFRGLCIAKNIPFHR